MSPNHLALALRLWDETFELYEAIEDLEAENRCLREVVTRILFWAAERDELHGFARAAIIARHPEPTRRAA